MKSKRLFVAMGNIDKMFIDEDAEEITNLKDRPQKRTTKFAPWLKLAVPLAACLIIVVTFMFNQKQPLDLDYSGLPKLFVNNEFDGQGFGFEGHSAFHINDLRNNNPWTENNNLTTLPVFSNPMEYDRAGAPINGLSAEEMLVKAEGVASILGLEVISLYTTPTQEQIEQIMQKLEGADEETIRMNTIA